MTDKTISSGGEGATPNHPRAAAAGEVAESVSYLRDSLDVLNLIKGLHGCLELLGKRLDNLEERLDIHGVLKP